MGKDKCFYCDDTGYIPQQEGIPDQMCPNCGMGQAVIKGFNAARDIGIQANETLRAANEQLREFIKELQKSSGELSGWAAAINWNRAKNTKDWMIELKKRIEKAQDVVSRVEQALKEK